ncbi:DUF6993 domain-containing protein [Agromyces aurantiacus]|uniref:DUF6993 domain-containing protein n=1 Tax=Agromyces aurantiacus TaxID=165814 RepID=A0ABV9RA35_9MICO|nr:hypothetical protein [Agromyces aurantiacus]MBM7504990.1 hypothetical protein [Agromyces aurantiacus]
MAVSALGALGAGAVVALSACTSAAPTDPTGAPPASPTASASAGPSATPAADQPPPALRPEGSAADNLAYFDAVSRAVIADDAGAGGRAFVDALTAAGFDRAAMQVTADTTTIGDPADSIQFSVEFAGECLIGQYGPKSDGYHSAVRPALGTGGCLVGSTRPIDW